MTAPRPATSRPALIRACADAARLFLPFVPERFRPALAALITALTLFALAYYPEAGPLAPDQPTYLATALLGTDTGARDVNVTVWPDHVALQDPAYDRAGHAALPHWQASLGPLTLPFAPSLGWPVDTYMRPVARKERALRVCLDPLRRHSAALAQEAWQAVVDSWDAYLDILPTEDTCAAPDLVLALGAERRDGGCGSSQAIGCAALLPRTRPCVGVPPPGGDGYYTCVTLNEAMVRLNQYGPREVYWTIVHEGKHAAGYGHTGEYGGEGRGHPHPSDLGFLCRTGTSQPCDNPTGRPVRQDFEDQPRVNTVWGLRFRGDPTPTPTPTPVTYARLWALRDELGGPCPGEVWFDQWCVVTVPTGRLWVDFNDRGAFVELSVPKE